MLAGYAISGLIQILTNAVGNFHTLVEKEVIHEQCRELTERVFGPAPERKQHFRSVARNRDTWPILYHAHPEKRAEVELKLKALNLASELGINYSGKSFSLATAANRIVLSLYKFIEAYRGREADVSVRIINGRSLTPDEESALNAWVREKLPGVPRLERKPRILSTWRKLGEELLPFFFGQDFEKHPQLRQFARHAEQTKAGHPARWSERKLVKRTLADAWKSIARDIGGE